MLDKQKDYLEDILRLLDEGGMAKATSKKLVKEISKEIDAIRIFSKIKINVPDEYFKAHPVNSANIIGPKEIILSEYLIGGN